VRHHIDDALAHQGREADRGAAIIGEDEEGAAIGNDAAVQCQTVHGRGHAMLADAVIDIAAGIVSGAEGLHVLRLGVVGPGQVSRTTHGVGQGGVDYIERVLRGIAGGDPRRIFGQLLLIGGHRSVKARGQLAGNAAVEFGLVHRCVEALIPVLAGFGTAGTGLAPGIHQVVRYNEGLVGPAELLAGAGDFFRAQRRTVDAGGAGLGRRTKADHRLASDENRLVGGLGGGERRGDLRGVVAIDA